MIMNKTVTENKYLMLADIKATISIEVKAKNQQEAERIAHYKLNDLTVANVELNIEHLSDEIIKPNVEDFYIQTLDVDEY